MFCCVHVVVTLLLLTIMMLQHGMTVGEGEVLIMIASCGVGMMGRSEG